MRGNERGPLTTARRCRWKSQKQHAASHHSGKTNYYFHGGQQSYRGFRGAEQERWRRAPTGSKERRVDLFLHMYCISCEMSSRTDVKFSKRNFRKRHVKFYNSLLSLFFPHHLIYSFIYSTHFTLFNLLVLVFTHGPHL